MTLQPNTIYIISGDVVDPFSVAMRDGITGSFICYHTSEDHAPILGASLLKQGLPVLTSVHGFDTLKNHQPHDPHLQGYRVTTYDPERKGCKSVPFCQFITCAGGCNG